MVEGELAAESLEAGGSSGTIAVLREITGATPPSPTYARYHETLLHRCGLRACWMMLFWACV